MLSKKIIIFTALFTVGFSFWAMPALATISLNFSNPLATDNVTTFLQGLMNHLQGIIAYLAVLFILLAGVLYIFAGTNEKMVTTAKTCLTASLIGFAIALAAPTFLKEIKSIVLGEGGQMPTGIENALPLKKIIGNAIKFVLSIFGTLAIIGLVVSGIIFATSVKDDSRTQAKKAMTYSILGILIASSAIILINTIVSLITK